MEKKIVFTNGTSEVVEDASFFNSAFSNSGKYYTISLKASGKNIGIELEKTFAESLITFRIIDGDKVIYECGGMSLFLSEQKFDKDGVLTDSIRFSFKNE